MIKRKSMALGMLCCIQALLPAMAQDYMAGGRVSLAPVPQQVSGVKQAVTSLNGEWEINFSSRISAGVWRKIKVPGEAAMQGFPVQHDTAFFYRRQFTVPADAAGKQTAIRFNGVYSYAKVYVNGTFVRDHFGGFTAWECDITPYAQPGKTAEIVVEVTDRLDEISFASGYAHHTIGGILRNVDLIVRPKTHIARLYTRTLLNHNYTTGELQIETVVTGAAGIVSCTLYSPDGKKVSAVNIPVTAGAMHAKIPVPQVITWTAERPQLYRLEVKLLQSGKTIAQHKEHVGFRDVRIDGRRQLLVNGQPVKLRGACRHDMHPLLGRSTNRQQDSLDVILAKGANFNFIRTSHYPPSKDFLEFCDRYGIYVQEETAICFVAQDRGGLYNKYGSSQNDTAYTSRYLGQLSEMIDRDRNHASIIMWSIGNESSYGTNFQKEYDFLKTIDTTRPVSWSWPWTALKEGKRCFDIAVGHYPVYDGKGSDMGGIDKNMEHPDYPLLSDEWAHVACYNTDLLRYDPNTKDYWGRSMDTTWLVRFDVPGNIGGAIWGMIDETFHMPEKVTGYGPWGIVDVWRRPKAEYWNTMKAYSPVRIGQTSFPQAKTGDVLQLPVKNRFDHTNLASVTCKLIVDGKTKNYPLPDIAPHANGVISLQTAGIRGNSALLKFYDPNGFLIEEERISWGPVALPVLPAAKVKWAGTSGDDYQSGNLQIIAPQNGAGMKIRKGNQELVSGLPEVMVNRPVDGNAFKNTAGIFSGPLEAANIKVTSNGETVQYTCSGNIGKYPVSYTVTLHASGLVEVQYEADSIPRQSWEIGIKIPVSTALDQISWNRKGYWSTYPAGHLSAAEGTAVKTGKVTAYRERPLNDIAQDMTDYYLAKSNDVKAATTEASETYRARKEHIYHFTLSQQNKPGKIRVISDGSQSAKMQIDAQGRQWLQVADKWDYWSLSWGNFQGTRNKSRKVSGTIKFIIE